MADYYDSIPGEERVVASSTLNADLRAVLATSRRTARPWDVDRLADALVAVLDLVDEMEQDLVHHESHEDMAEIRTPRGWKNVDDYQQDIRAAIAGALGIEGEDDRG